MLYISIHLESLDIYKMLFDKRVTCYSRVANLRDILRLERSTQSISKALVLRMVL